MRTFKINDELVRVSPSWEITDKLNARTTLSFTVVDMLSLEKIDNGDTVSVFNDSELIFNGIILDIDKHEPSPGLLEYGIKSVDNAALADNRRIAIAYDNKTAGYIARDIIASKLAEEGVTEGVIQNGPIIKKAVFNYITCADALNYLKTITGFVWNIDNERKLNMFDRTTHKAPFILTDQIRHNNFRQTSTMSKYRNTQYVRGGKGRTAFQECEKPTPKPDGESRNFILRYPIADKPAIEVNLNNTGWVLVSQNDIGINGIDKNKKWYYSYGNQVITQDDSENALTDQDALRISYTGLRNLFVKIDNPAEINLRKSTENSRSGIYEDLSTESNINDVNQAIQYAQGLIETYGQINDTISFDTSITGLKAGQLLRISKPLYEVADDFLIESVSIRPDGPNLIKYSVKALDGAAVGGWEEFFKNLVNGNKDFLIAENEVVITIQTQSEAQGFIGQYDIKTLNALYPSDNLYPSNNLFPGTITGGVNLND